MTRAVAHLRRARPARPSWAAPSSGGRGFRTGGRGFTILELLVAIVLFSIISIAMFNLLISQNRFFDTQEAGNATQQNTRIAMKRVANDLMLVGKGINTVSLDNPDVIIPNDGTVSLNTYQTDAITLISLPDAVPQIPFAADVPRSARTVLVKADSSGIAAGLKPGNLVIFHETKLNSSQLVNLTAVTTVGANVKLDFAAADSLLAGYPKRTSQMYTLTAISYRVNKSDATRPYLERQLNSLAWEKMMPGVESMSFTYYDQDNGVLTPTTQALRKLIRKVRVQIDGRSVRPIDSKGNRIKISMATDVTPRNMME